ncbi:MAG TPA: hypothetical protein DIV86_03935, partial [Alphaproteobacteria bacterium]|nr:hypothetical protein [Alphaproteobacteria bacterium]
MRNLYKYVLVIPLAFCAVACGRYEYHNQSKFAALNQGSILLQQPVLADGQIVPLEYTAKVKNRTLGGFSFTPSGIDKNGRPHDPVMFSLRREKQSIQAETVLFESKNKAKTFFDTDRKS